MGWLTSLRRIRTCSACGHAQPASSSNDLRGIFQGEWSCARCSTRLDSLGRLVDRRATLPDRAVFNTMPETSWPRYAAAAVSVTVIISALFTGLLFSAMWAAGVGLPRWSQCTELWVVSMGMLLPTTPIAIAHFRPGMAPYQQLTLTSSWLEVTGDRVDFEQIEDVTTHGNSIQIRTADRTLSVNSVPDLHQAISQALERYRARTPSRVPKALQRLRHGEHRE